MYPRLARLAILLMVLLASLLPAACNIPDRAEPAEPVQDAAEPTAEPIAAPAAEDLAAVVNRNANVRTGPSTDHSVAYWLTAGDEVAIVGTSADGDWLQIEHQDRPGWIASALVDFEDATRAEVEAAPEPESDPPAPMDEPTDVDEPETVAEPAVEPVAEPTEAVEPTPAPTPQTELPGPLSVTVTGTTVNLRQGPGTEHPTDGQVRAGDALQATGRNAAGDWLLIVHPAATGELVWIYAPLTDIDDTALRTLAAVSAVVIGTPPAQESAAAPAPQSAAPTVPADCTRLHTVNPNETRLQQITDWFDLDLAATAALNGLAPDTPLTAGWQLCLPDPAAPPPQAPQAPAAQPQPAPASQPVAGGPCFSRTGTSMPCPDYVPADRPDLAVTSVAGDATYHAPGSYDRAEHPGLAYDFELIFEDRSGMWNWRMRDFEGCYDALRIHMGDIPEAIGLTRLEIHLWDPILGDDWNMDDLAREQLRGMRFQTTIALPQPVVEEFPDLGRAQLRCFEDRNRSADHVVCAVLPFRGNSGSVHVDAAVNIAISSAAGQMSRQSLAYQYFWYDRHHRLPYMPYLYPMLPDGSPAGRGPCFEMTRAH